MTEDKCEYCGGQLTWLNLPNTVYITEKPKEPITYTPIQICEKCSRIKETEAIKRLPTLEDLQKETDLRRQKK